MSRFSRFDNTFSLTHRRLHDPFSRHDPNFIPVQSHLCSTHRSTCSSYVVTVARPPSSSSLKTISNLSLRYASPFSRSDSFRRPVDHQCLSLSSHLRHISSSSSSSSLSLPITASIYHSMLKTCLLHKSFSPSSRTFYPPVCS